MKMRIGTPFIAISICLMLLPFTSLVAVSGTGPAALTSVNDGSTETFDNVKTGTVLSFNDFTLAPNYNTDTVVLDGRLWIMFRGNDSSPVVRYAPAFTGTDWTISFDAFTPRNGASYSVQNKVPGLYGLKVMVTGSNGKNLTGIELLVGPRGTEGVLSYDAADHSWNMESSGILPALSNLSSIQESSPDRYSVSISRTAPDSIRLSVVHSRAGTIFSRTIAIDPGSDPAPALQFYSAASVGFIPGPDTHGAYPNSGGWMLDNFETRPAGTGTFEVQPSIEVVHRSDPLWVKVIDPFGSEIDDAVVTIAGRQARFNQTNDRYEVASLMQEVNWVVPTAYTATKDGVTLSGLIKVTTTPDPSAASVTKWWNGWTWATVLGRDDCSGPQTVLDTYKGYDHPLTAYIFTDNPTGSSSMILRTQSEIAKHGPHDYYNWMKKTWDEAVASANQGQQGLKKAYTFASRWDDPSYVGNGDTYISLANPGNTATFQVEYAQYMAGIRIEGTSSVQGNGAPGNDSIIGAWGVDPWAKADPMSQIDLMDAVRQVNTDGNVNMSNLLSLVQKGYLVRIYNHGTIAQPNVLHWICDNKTDGTLENWKATDGEAASYTYGSLTTDVRQISSEDRSNLQVFEVTRQNPKSAGYWLVPVTIAIPLKGYSVDSIEIVGSEATLSSLDHSNSGLKNLSGARVMDVGYDIRDGILYVSAFWNASSELRIHFTPHDPSILNKPNASIPVETPYVFNATSTNGTGEIIWTLQTDAPFLSIEWSDRTHCLLTGTAHITGHFKVRLTVSSTVHSDSVNYTLIVWQPPDLDPPVTIISGSVGHWVNDWALFNFTATDDVSGVERTEYSIDGGTWREWTRSIQITTEGRHIVRYYSVDNAGNVEGMKQAEVLIDRHAPETVFDNPSHQQFYGGKIQLRFSSWDNLSGIGSVRIMDESGTYFSALPRSGSVTLENVALGNRTYVLEVKDVAGNLMTTTIIVNERPGGSMSWNNDLTSNLLILSLASGLLCIPAVILGRRMRG